MSNTQAACKKCFQPVEPNIAKCPHCAAEHPADSIGVQLFSYAVVMILVAGVLFGYKSCTDSNAGKQETPERKQGRMKIEAANKTCGILEQTGIVHECDISAFSHEISFRVDANGVEAKKICKQVADMEHNSVLGYWKIIIYSPFSGDHPIASCII